MPEIETPKERPGWLDRVIGFICGLILGPLIGASVCIFLVFMGYSWWWLLLPVAGAVVGPAIGMLFPKFAIDMFDGTTFLGRPLSNWIVDWLT
ncbi:MAG: hypothetical protein AAF916_03125 [Planctomycetota bacterium]